MKTKTQRYTDRLCDYTNWLLGVWKKGEDVDSRKINKCLNKIDYLIALLKIDAQKIGNMQWFNIPFQKQQEKDRQALWKEYQKRPPEERLFKEPTREEILREIQLKAQKITKNPEIEAGTFYKNQITKERLEDLLSSLSYLQKVLKTNRISQEAPLHGDIANNLVTELGLVSKNRLLAIQHNIVNYKKMPYDPTVWQNNVSLAMGGGYPEKIKKSIESWIQKTQKLFCNLQNIHNNEIPSEYRTAPTSKARLVTCWGGDMTMAKLRNMIKKGHIRCIEQTRQTYTFDKRDLPDKVSRALEQ